MRTSSTGAQRCKVCGARLSLYNDDILCFSCQEKEQEEAIKKELYKPLRGKIGYKILDHNTGLNIRGPHTKPSYTLKIGVLT